MIPASAEAAVVVVCPTEGSLYEHAAVSNPETTPHVPLGAAVPQDHRDSLAHAPEAAPRPVSAPAPGEHRSASCRWDNISYVERSLTEGELGVVSVLASADAPGADDVRECIPHLVVTRGCECGCHSFDLRDRRYERADSGSRRFSNAWTPDHSHGFTLLLDGDRRPQTCRRPVARVGGERGSPGAERGADPRLSRTRRSASRGSARCASGRPLSGAGWRPDASGSSTSTSGGSSARRAGHAAVLATVSSSGLGRTGNRSLAPR